MRLAIQREKNKTKKVTLDNLHPVGIKTEKIENKKRDVEIQSFLSRLNYQSWLAHPAASNGVCSRPRSKFR